MKLTATPPGHKKVQSAQPSLAPRNISPEPETQKISLIFDRQFEAAVLAATLRSVFPQAEVRVFETEVRWLAQRSKSSSDETVVYNIGASPVSEKTTIDELRNFITCAEDCRVIVLSRTEEPMAIFDVLACGAASYIPPSANLEELVDALRMRSFDSVIVPRRSLLALKEALYRKENPPARLEQHFTKRQLLVARALQRGGTNEQIARDLGIRESTVKAHIRTILTKLNVNNRTRAAYLLNQLEAGDTDIEISAE